MGRFLTFVPVVTSLVAFISEVTNATGWWVYSLDRASYVLVVLAVVAALMSERQTNAIVLGAQIAAAATALVFMAVALVKFYEAIPAFGQNYSAALPWVNEAKLLAAAVLAFGLTLTRRRSAVTIAGLMAAMAIAFGCAIYAITQKGSYAAEVWWLTATAGAFLAAAAAAGLERDGTDASGGAPVASSVAGDLLSDSGVA